MKLKNTTKDKVKTAIESEGENFAGHLEKTAKITAVFGIFGIVIWGIFFDGFFESVLFAILLALISGTVFFTMPLRKSEKNAKKIEKYLPFALMQLSIDLKTGRSFDVALKNITNSNYGLLSEKLGEELAESKKSGKATPEILLRFGKKINSRTVKRTISRILSVYEIGNKEYGSDSIRKIALEQLSRQKAEMKEYSAKIATVSLVFIVASAIIPALFQSFTIVGSSFIELPFDATQAIIISAVMFPLIDTSILFYITAVTPEFLKG